MERTFAIIKPDGVERNLIGKILERIESNGFRVVAMKRTLLSKAQAELLSILSELQQIQVILHS